MINLTIRAVEALILLKGSNPQNTISASALASKLWPDRLEACHTSRKRGGLYRAAGAYYSKLAKKGWVGIGWIAFLVRVGITSPRQVWTF